MPAAVDEPAFREILSTALSGIKGLARATRDRVLDEYAPKLAQVNEADTPEERDARYQAVLVNVRAVVRIAGIRGEAAVAAAVVAALKTALGFAKVVL